MILSMPPTMMTILEAAWAGAEAASARASAPAAQE
jgi:hypothetical protein